MAKEDVEDARGVGEKGCHELSEMESGSWRDCWQSGENSATPVYGNKPGSKLDWIGIYQLESAMNKICVNSAKPSKPILEFSFTATSYKPCAQTFKGHILCFFVFPCYGNKAFYSFAACCGKMVFLIFY